MFGKPVTISASVSGSGGTGSVTFYNGVSVLGTSALSGGYAALTTNLLPCCSASLSARYNGNPSYASSVSAPVHETILISAMNGFAPASTFAAGMFPSWVATGDFNGDGIPDLVLSDAGDTINGICVLLGRANGSFEAAQFYPAGTGAFAVAVGDFNGDGISDLAVANAGDARYNVSILLGVGDGTFQAPINSQFQGYYPWAIVAADFNGDGRLDVATANLESGTVTVFLGNGDGTLSSADGPVSFNTPPAALAVGDFNQDGLPDLAVADGYGGPVSILIGKGDGTFSPGMPVNGFSNPSGLAVADFNGDGKQDLAVADLEDADSSDGRVVVILGNGNGTFQSPSATVTVIDAQGIAAGDLNGDGKLDVVATTDAGISILYGNGDGTLQPAVTLSAGAANTTEPSSIAIALADFNGDSLTDIAVANYEDYNAAILLGKAGTCAYSISPPASTFDATGGSFTLSVTSNSPGCVWSAAASPSLTLSPSSGAGSQSITVTVPPNTTGLALTGTIALGGQTASVGQWATAQTFNDVPITAYYFDAVNLLKAKNVTSGCGNNDYCPGENVTRAQMAIFIVRSIFGGDNFTFSPTPHFNDVPANAFGFAWIQKMFELNITGGCGGGNYCPGNSVTRDQMAVFVIRARFGATTVFDFPSTPTFGDVPSTYWAFQWIQRMAVDSITGGCGNGDYCPANAVSRGDMALFLMRGAFNQLLPAGTPLLSQITPATLTHGLTATFTITGQFTSFLNGTTSIKPVPGLSIGTAAVTAPGTLSVQLTAASNAALQPVSLVAVTGTQEAILPNGLTIE